VTVIHEIQQILWLETPHGTGQALFIMDYGPHQNTVFIVALLDSGQILHYNSNQVKICQNITFDFLEDHKNL